MGNPKVSQSKCIACFVCAEECPVDAIKVSRKNGKAWINPKICIDCGTCVDACPVNAIKRKK